MGLRIAYGYGRRPADFAHVERDDLYLDGPGTERMERRAMIREKLRRGAGDVVILLAPGDLGEGKGLALIRAELDAMGATLEIAPPPAPAERNKPGRPPACDLTPEQHERFGALWRDRAVDGGYVVTKACAEAGMDAADKRVRHLMRQRLRRLFGVRRPTEERG